MSELTDRLNAASCDKRLATGALCRDAAVEIARLTKERDIWEQEALRYFRNADYWRRESDAVIERCAEMCGKYASAEKCAAAIRALTESESSQPGRM